MKYHVVAIQNQSKFISECCDAMNEDQAEMQILSSYIGEVVIIRTMPEDEWQKLLDEVIRC